MRRILLLILCAFFAFQGTTNAQRNKNKNQEKKEETYQDFGNRQIEHRFFVQSIGHQRFCDRVQHEKYQNTGEPQQKSIESEAEEAPEEFASSLEENRHEPRPSLIQPTDFSSLDQRKKDAPIQKNINPKISDAQDENGQSDGQDWPTAVDQHLKKYPEIKPLQQRI